MNYSDEEEEAIEQLRSWRDYIIKNTDKVNKANDIEFYLRTALNLIQKQDKIIDKMAEHLADVIKNDDNASLLPFSDSEDNLEAKVKEYFKKVVDEDVKD